LRFFLARSDLVVLGEIASQPVGISSEVGVVEYACDFRVAEVLKGDKPGPTTLRVMIVRFELEEGDQLPELKKGGKCILFLKRASRGDIPPWRTADFWFGVQRPNLSMGRSLKRLAEQDEATPKR
jgi:hypothetical protein